MSAISDGTDEVERLWERMMFVEAFWISNSSQGSRKAEVAAKLYAASGM